MSCPNCGTSHCKRYREGAVGDNGALTTPPMSSLHQSRNPINHIDWVAAEERMRNSLARRAAQVQPVVTPRLNAAEVSGVPPVRQYIMDLEATTALFGPTDPIPPINRVTRSEIEYRNSQPPQPYGSRRQQRVAEEARHIAERICGLSPGACIDVVEHVFDEVVNHIPSFFHRHLVISRRPERQSFTVQRRPT